MKLITATRFATCAAYLTCVPYIAGAALCLLLLSVGVAQAQTTQFTYQGRLNDGGNAANGAYDMQFKLFDALSAGAQVGSTVSLTSVNVSGGIFTVTLDFGAGSFPGANRFLEINVRLPGSGTVLTLNPRQPVTATPYAIQSLNAANATNATNATTATNFSGALAGAVTGTQAATAIANNAVTTPKIADANVTDAKIVTVAGSKITGAITTATIPGANITGAIVNATNAMSAVNFSGALAGDVTGTQGATTVAKLQGRAVANLQPQDQQVLKFDVMLSQWIPASAPVPAGSTNYIQNGTALQAGSNFNISGNGTVGGALNSRVLRQELTASAPNLIQGFLGTGSGGATPGNRVTAGVVGASIGGGGFNGTLNFLDGSALTSGDNSNRVTDWFGTIAGGIQNRAGNDDVMLDNALFATVGGGFGNTASGSIATVGGGLSNNASGQAATVGGGEFNTASGVLATVSGGNNNTASGVAATVHGGDVNIASGNWSVVSGGEFNTASGARSFAAGFNAKANHQGAFVWADSTNADFASTSNNQFLIRATGGVGIGLSNPSSPLTVNGVIESRNGGIKFPDGSTQAVAATGGNFIQNRTTQQASSNFNISGNGMLGGNLGIGASALTTGLLNLRGGNAPELGQAAINGQILLQSSGTFGGAIGVADPGGNSSHMWIQSRYTDSATYRPLALNPSGGNVGIGTTSPAAKLDVNGILGVHDGGTHTLAGGIATESGATIINFGLNDIRFGTQNPANQGGFIRVDGRNNFHLFQVFGRAANASLFNFLNITANGAIGIGIGPGMPSEIVDVGGNVLASAFFTNSDLRYKQRIETIPQALAKLLQMHGVSYQWKSAEYPQMRFSDRTQLGFIAQELKEVLPEAVQQEAQGMYSVNYSAVIPVLVEGMKEQQALIQTLQTEKEALAQRLTKLEQMLQQLKEQAEKQPQPKQQ